MEDLYGVAAIVSSVSDYGKAIASSLGVERGIGVSGPAEVPTATGLQELVDIPGRTVRSRALVDTYAFVDLVHVAVGRVFVPEVHVR